MFNDASAYRAIEWINANPDTGSARVLALLIVSTANGGRFGLDDCRGTLDGLRMEFAQEVCAAAGTESLAAAARLLQEQHPDLIA